MGADITGLICCLTSNTICIRRHWSGGEAALGLPATAGPTQTVNHPHHSRSSLLSWKRNTPRTPGGGTTQARPRSHPHAPTDTCCAQASSAQDVRWVCGTGVRTAGEGFHNKWRFQWFRHTSSQLPLQGKKKKKSKEHRPPSDRR